MFDEDMESPIKNDEEEMQQKSLEVSAELSLKADSEDGTFSGYASIFGNKDLGGDVVEEGAFVKSLRRRKAKQNEQLQYNKRYGKKQVNEGTIEEENRTSTTGSAYESYICVKSVTNCSNSRCTRNMSPSCFLHGSRG